MLGAELRSIRESKGLSLRDVSELCGVSKEGIGSVERGLRYPSLETLERLATCLEIRVVIGPGETHIEPNGP